MPQSKNVRPELLLWLAGEFKAGCMLTQSELLNVSPDISRSRVLASAIVRSIHKIKTRHAYPWY